MKKIRIFAMVLVASVTTNAQEKVETTIEADVVNQYIWRGQNLGSTAVQPTLGASWKGLSLTAWGSYALTDASDTKELDLTLDYTVGGLNIGVTDYWFNTPSDRYFLYDAHRTSHVFEANVGYDFGPIALQWYTNFVGNDGVSNSGKRAYSSYAELSVPFALAGAEWTATVGAVPYASTSYGASGFAVTNVALQATKDVRITDTFSLPLFAGLVGNPCDRRANLVFGVTLHP